MILQDSHKQLKIKRTILWFNQLINLFWSVLALGPLGYFCYTEIDSKWTYLFLVISSLSIFLPNYFFDFIQLSSNTPIYNRLGIRTVKKYTQDGDLINQLLQKRFSHYDYVSTIKIKKLLRRSYINERFHFSCLLFFLLTGLYAIRQRYWWWLCIIGMSNLFFNVYPIFLQQYNRIRLKKLIIRRRAMNKK